MMLACCPTNALPHPIPSQVHIPRDARGGNRRVALVCTHPWAVMGGNMTNNVPSFLCSYFARLGFLTLKFNFGNGTFTRGHGELEDVEAACRFLREQLSSESESSSSASQSPASSLPPTLIYLVGYSYGSMIANAAAGSLDCVSGFVGVSTPFSVFWALSLFNGKRLLEMSHCAKPKLLISGQQSFGCC